MTKAAERLTATRRREIQMVVETAIMNAQRTAEHDVANDLANKIGKTPLISPADREVLERYRVDSHSLARAVQRHHLPLLPQHDIKISVRLAKATTETEAREVFPLIEQMEEAYAAWRTECLLLITHGPKRAKAMGSALKRRTRR